MFPYLFLLCFALSVQSFVPPSPFCVLAIWVLLLKGFVSLKASFSSGLFDRLIILFVCLCFLNPVARAHNSHVKFDTPFYFKSLTSGGHTYIPHTLTCIGDIEQFEVTKPSQASIFSLSPPPTRLVDVVVTLHSVNHSLLLHREHHLID